jgi:hypothetical protein
LLFFIFSENLSKIWVKNWVATTIIVIIVIVVVVVFLFIIYTINLSMVRPRFFRVIYYFDTLNLREGINLLVMSMKLEKSILKIISNKININQKKGD